MIMNGNTDAAGIIKPQPARWSEGLHDAAEMMRKVGNMDAAGIYDKPNHWPVLTRHR